MRPSKGSFSLVFLIGVFFITIFAQIILAHVKHSYESTVNYAQSLQIRNLTNSIGQWFAAQPIDSQEIHLSKVIYPGSKAIEFDGTRTFSTDGCFEHLHLEATIGTDKQCINRLKFVPTQEQQTLGNSYMFISKTGLTGSEFLGDGSLYTSIGSLTLPDISFLKTKAHTNFDISWIHDYGFDNNFTYLGSSTTLSYLSTAKITKGNGLLASNNGIIIKKSFTAPDRLVIIAKGSVTIEDYVTLGNVLIMTNNSVSIGKSCKINGVIFSGGKITIGGRGTFTHDASAVASFASAYYIV